MHARFFLAFLLSLLAQCASAPASEQEIPTGWTTESPRPEIRPQFSFDAKGGPKQTGSLAITSDDREGLHGWFQKTFPVTGGKAYRFSAWRKATNIDVPRRAAVVRILWRDDQNQPVPMNEPVISSYLKGWKGTAEPEHPTDQASAQGWTEVADTYQVPAKATKAVVELQLRWAPKARIEWSDVSLTETSNMVSRKVRLAAIHFRPSGKSPMSNCEEYEPYIADAAKQKADLVVLGETLTFINTKKKYADCAEPVPGPSTDYFGKLAKKHRLHIVAGLLEKDRHLVYNVAVMLGPDGNIIGKYRKVCLPRGEIEAGIAPGSEYPVFNTQFGKVGMMVCYDGFFPEVARELTNQGAEIIAWPVWGCNPELASARACENHVYVISNTYTDTQSNWMLTAIYNHDGKPLVHAEKWGSVIVTEVDLDKRMQWNSLGDFKAELLRHRPVTSSDRN